MRFISRMFFLVSVAIASAMWSVPLPAGAQLVGIESGTGFLYSISPVNASLTLIGNTGITDFGEIERSPNGTMYGFTVGSGPSLYSIDPQTASASLIGPLNQPFVFEGGLAFAPNGKAYATNGGTSNDPQLLTIDVTTGNATVIGTISGGMHDINGLAYRSDGELIGLDRVTNSLLLIDPTTASSSLLAPLAPVVGALGGMTVLDGVGYFDTSGPASSPPGSNSLYSFDLFSGASSLVGSFSPTITGAGISGLAAVPEPSTLVLAAAAFTIALALRRFRVFNIGRASL